MTKLPDFNHHPANAFAHFIHRDSHPGLTPYAYALHQRMAEGHICLDVGSLPRNPEFWSGYEPGMPDPLPELPTSHPLVGKPGQEHALPLILWEDRLYTGRYFWYAKTIAKHLLGMATTPPQLPTLDPSTMARLRSMDDISSFAPEEKPDWQLVAALQALSGRITFVTGGPGTGKTTTVAKVLAALHAADPKVRIALAAPTGKAADRLRESLTTQEILKYEAFEKDEPIKFPANTIHKLLGAKAPDKPFFKHGPENPLPYDAVVIDECSMIGMALFAKLLHAIGPDTRLILVGDPDQLASVEAGKMFGDICRLLEDNQNRCDEAHRSWLNVYMAPERQLGQEWALQSSSYPLDGRLVRLFRSHRFDGGSAFGDLTRAINRGDAATVARLAAVPSETFLFDPTWDEGTFEEFVAGYAEYIRCDDIKGALELFTSRRILCALREGKRGVSTANARAERILSARVKGFRPSGDFYEHQPILVTRNMKELDLNNGDVGIVRRSNWHKDQLMVFFPCASEKTQGAIIDGQGFRGIRAVNPGFLSDWETVFAMTIHKSQGSEYKHVLVSLPEDKDNPLLTRELLYTAVTRAKSGGRLVVQGSEEVVRSTVERRVERESGMSSFLTQNTKP